MPLRPERGRDPVAMDWKTTSTILERLSDFDERTAWGLLAEHFRAPIERLGRRMGLEAGDAEDAAQEALLDFAREYRDGRYDRSRGRLKSWLFGFAHNRIRKTRAKAGAAPHPLGGGDDSSSGLPEPVAEGAAEEWWEDEWTRALYERALARVEKELSPPTFELFRRVVLEGTAPADVAEERAVPLSRVYNARYRVTRRLAVLVRELDDA